MASRIGRFLSCKGKVSIELGRLVVLQPNGKEVDPDWVKNHSTDLLHEILATLKIDAYEYRSYSTGYYDQGKHPGVSLQFRSTINDEASYVVFNVSLTRSRTTKAGKKGSPLPKGHFHVGDRSHFCKFWKSTPLAVPKSLTSFHDYMGNLKNILFTANPTEGGDDGRMDAGSIIPLSVSPDLVRKAFLPDSSPITSGYTPDKIRITTPDKNLALGHTGRPSQPISTACDRSYGKTVIRGRDDTGPNPATRLPKRPQVQTIDEWTVDFCS